MTAHAWLPPTRTRVRRLPFPTGRGGLLAVLLVAPTILAGCGMRLVGQRIDPGGHGPRPERTELQAKILAAREQSALDPQEPYWLYRLGQIYHAADSLPQAEAALEASLSRDRSYAPALSLLSKLYYDAGRHQEAVAMLESARSRPDAFPGGAPPDLLAGLALHYDALGRADLAGALVAALPSSRPRSTRSARVYVTLRGPTPEAASDLAAAAVADDPGSAVNQNNFGITRMRAGDPKSAQRAFLKAIEIDPKLAGPYYNLSILEKFYLFDDEAAARWLKAYRDRSSADPDSLFGAFHKSESRKLAGKEAR